MTTCPAGHESTATDYCDTCGLAMPPPGRSQSGSAETPPPPAPPGGPGSPCPSCGVSNPADALFCEACGYDYTTGTMPRSAEATGLMPAASDMSPSEPVAAPVAEGPAPVAKSPAPALQRSWVAEVWIDPDWYAAQGSADPLPSPGLPTIVQLRHTSVLIGRASRSRGITPDIDLSGDSGVSRRHAQLSTDGSRWFVEDLGSSNGSYVGEAGARLPDVPLPPGQKRELGPDGRIYLGAWTRLVVREAAPEEFG